MGSLCLSPWEEDKYKIIEIFDNHPLNSTKQLDFMAWKEAFLTYQSTKIKHVKNPILLRKILSLKDSMNKTDLLYHLLTKLK